MALGDVDGSGQLDLFVGGRVLAGAYPQSATSLLMRKNEHGKFEVRQKFEQVGMVSGAVFSDLDGDGKAEIIVFDEADNSIKAWHGDGKPIAGSDGVIAKLPGAGTGV